MNLINQPTHKIHPLSPKSDKQRVVVVVVVVVVVGRRRRK